MNLRTQKRIAADILKCGVSRVRIKQPKDVAEALTREDIRGLIKKGAIVKIQEKGTSKRYVRIRLSQKKRGRRKGMGSRRGSMGARNPRKPEWIKSVRAIRSQLKELKLKGQLKDDTYTHVYSMIKGGAFRNKKHLLLYLKERELIKQPKKP